MKRNDERSAEASHVLASRGITAEMRHHLEHEVEHLSHVLPGQGPIDTFIHHNTLHGFQHLHFEKALAEAQKVVGGRGYLTLEQFRQHYATGRITDEDLAVALRERDELAPEDVLAQTGDIRVTAREVQRIALLHGIDPLEPGESPEQRLGPDALRRLRPDVAPDVKKRLLDAAKRELDVVPADLEAQAVSDLMLASLDAFGLPDVFAVHPDPLLLGEHEGARIEALFERIEMLEAWGGPAIPLDDDLHARVEDEVRAYLDPVSSGGTRQRAASSEIARLCLTIVHDLGPDHLRRRGFEALRALLSLKDDPASSEALLEALASRDPRQKMLARAKSVLEEDLGRLGPELSHRDLLLVLTGEDIHERVHPELIRMTAAFLDEGLSAWHVGRSLGFYDAWRKMVEGDISLELNEMPGAREALRELPPLPVDAVIQGLLRLGVPEAHWGTYLRRLCLALPGFSAMVYWRQTHPGYAAQRVHPIDLLQYLAVRLFYETLFVRQLSRRVFGHDGSVEDFRHHLRNHLPELFIRHALHRGQLPDFLAERVRAVLAASQRGEAASEETMTQLADMVWHYKASAEIVIEGGHTARRSAFRIFLLAQHLGLSAGQLRAMPLEDKERLLAALDEHSPAKMEPIWQTAYEVHYRDEVLHALAKNLADPPRRFPGGRPAAQVVFCMDDREESIRRYIEELRSDYVTYGVAGFFGVAIDYQGLGCSETFALCPVVATPAHRLAETPRPEALETWSMRRRRTALEGTLRDVFREMLRNPVSSFFLVDVVGLIAALPLLGRVLFPGLYERALRSARATAIPEVKTEVPFNLEAPVDPAGDPPRKPGLTTIEQADRVGNTLRNMGMMGPYAPIIVFYGHGSESRNNPHLSAYDCGACGGKHGGPNARVFAAMANRKEVRDVLRTRGIDIPDDTWFVGAEHNTCTDVLTYFDVDDAPAEAREKIREVQQVVEQAAYRSAEERCRKFASAPRVMDPESSFAHVNARAADISQARPELGHATNAFCIIGQRAISEGVFLDRRAFLISYDPAYDPEGKIIEGTLLAAGPVGAGISLEYYFSTVDNLVYGCGTKIPHNLCGLIGVMEGVGSDLRTGLPRQMIEIHEPMRLVLLVQAKPEILGMIYERQPIIRELVGNAWVQLVSMNPETKQFMVFLPGRGFVPWQDRGGELPVVPGSRPWYVGQMDFLPPALIRKEPPRTETKRAKKREKVAHA
jgi:hypothetical protein